MLSWIRPNFFIYYLRAYLTHWICCCCYLVAWLEDINYWYNYFKESPGLGKLFIYEWIFLLLFVDGSNRSLDVEIYSKNELCVIFLSCFVGKKKMNGKKSDGSFSCIFPDKKKWKTFSFLTTSKRKRKFLSNV